MEVVAVVEVLVPHPAGHIRGYKRRASQIEVAFTALVLELLEANPSEPSSSVIPEKITVCTIPQVNIAVTATLKPNC